MTKTALLQRHKIDGIMPVVEDIATHMQRALPVFPMTAKLDPTLSAMYAGRMEGWHLACEYLRQINVEQKAPEVAPGRNYSEGQGQHPQPQA